MRIRPHLDVPTPEIFLAAAIVCVLTLAPLLFTLRSEKKQAAIQATE